MNAPSAPSWLEALLEPSCLVDATRYRIFAVNRAFARLVGLPVGDFADKSIVELTSAPEDLYFWEDVAAGLSDSICSETWVRSAEGEAIPVERKVGRFWLRAGEPCFLVTMRDLRPQRQTEEALEEHLAELKATLESTGDGILVLNKEGAVRHYNRRFLELWGVPESVLNTGQDANLLAHMLDNVNDQQGYQEQLEQIAQDPLRHGTDVLLLRSGRMLECVTLPQTSRGRVLGRVYSYRDLTERLDAQNQALQAEVNTLEVQVKRLKKPIDKDYMDELVRRHLPVGRAGEVIILTSPSAYGGSRTVEAEPHDGV